MIKLSTQLWITDKDHVSLRKELMLPVKNNKALGIKGDGGLWTSSYLGEEEGSEWLQYARGGTLYSSNDLKGYLLKPKEDLKILVIDTLKDMHLMYDKYGYEMYRDIFDSEKEAIDFEEMSKEYDAFHITTRGQMVTRFGHSFFGDPYFNEEVKEEWKEKKLRNLYGYDCESTFHFRWNFKKVEPIELKIDRGG